MEEFEKDYLKEVSIKDAINYAIEVIYDLNDRLDKPFENPFEVKPDLDKENFLWAFVDHE